MKLNELIIYKMNNTPKETEDIKIATQKARNKHSKLQKEREKDCYPIYLKDNKNTVIITKKGNDPEEIKSKYENLPKY